MTFLLLIDLISEDSVVIDLDEREKRLAELEEIPLHIFDINLEIAHEQIAYLPGRSLIFVFNALLIPKFNCRIKSRTRFIYKKLGSAPSTKSFLISHENFAIIVLKVF